MADILSQNEVADLLAKVDAANRKASNDNNPESRPDKFSREQLREISIIHDKFALLANHSLSEQLNSKVSIKGASIDQLYMGEFFRTIPIPATMGLISMKPLNGIAIMEIYPAITFAIIDKISGGSKEPKNSWYELTAAEKKIIEDVFAVLLENLREAWSEIAELQPRLEKIETDPKFIRNVTPDEWIVLVTLEAQIAGVEGMVDICLPHTAIEPILEKL